MFPTHSCFQLMFPSHVSNLTMTVFICFSLYIIPVRKEFYSHWYNNNQVDMCNIAKDILSHRLERMFHQDILPLYPNQVAKNLIQLFSYFHRLQRFSKNNFATIGAGIKWKPVHDCMCIQLELNRSRLVQYSHKLYPPGISYIFSYPSLISRFTKIIF